MSKDTGFHPTGVEEVETEVSRLSKANRAQRYLQGPIWVDDIRTATKLGGTCLALLLLIYHRRAVTGRNAVTLPNGYLAEFGIDKSAKQRGLKHLERAKLITLERAVGHSVSIELRSVRNRKSKKPKAKKRNRWKRKAT